MNFHRVTPQPGRRLGTELWRSLLGDEGPDPHCHRAEVDFDPPGRTSRRGGAGTRSIGKNVTYPRGMRADNARCWCIQTDPGPVGPALPARTDIMPLHRRKIARQPAGMGPVGGISDPAAHAGEDVDRHVGATGLGDDLRALAFHALQTSPGPLSCLDSVTPLRGDLAGCPDGDGSGARGLTRTASTALFHPPGRTRTHAVHPGATGAGSLRLAGGEAEGLAAGWDALPGGPERTSSEWPCISPARRSGWPGGCPAARAGRDVPRLPPGPSSSAGGPSAGSSWPSRASWPTARWP